MNDDSALGTVRDSLTTAKESLTGVHMNMPLDTIVRHGRARRRRYRLTGLSAAGAVAAGAALAVTALAPASPQASRQPAAHLTAWTVAKLADGNVSVYIHELRDPAGLQRKLRADGVPASVIFYHQRNPCRPYPGGTPRPDRPISPLLKSVFPRSYRLSPSGGAIVIHRSALPDDAGVQLAAGFSSTPGGGSGVAAPIVVYASPHCTGS